MVARITSTTLVGLECVSVFVEVDLALGLPGFHIVGLPDASVQESCDRVRTALRNSGYSIPNRKVTINLAPGDVRKEGPRFDLAIALGVLVADQKLPEEALDGTLVLGELSLDGQVRPVRGALSAALHAHQLGYARILVPAENTVEAELVQGIRVLRARTLEQCVRILTGHPDCAHPALVPVSAAIARVPLVDLCEVAGQLGPRRALEIAAAGAHHVLMVGPPGCGKTMLARALPSILPPLTEPEALDVARVYSAFAGQRLQALPRERPFLAPGHSLTVQALLGSATPGEVSRAHHGVLFLDEFPEFRRSCLEGLRTALEEGEVTVTRVHFKARYPARFLLVAAMNPCPCGYHGDRQQICSCGAGLRTRYFAKLSGPLRDRMDMHLVMHRPAASDLLRPGTSESSASVLERVVLARERQYRRGQLNSVLTGSALLQACALGSLEQAYLENFLKKLHFSPRAFSRILRVARTIADLAGAAAVSKAHLGEAVAYRALDRMESEAAA